VLIGTAYWQGLLGWLRDTVLADGKISAADLDRLTLTDDVDEAVQLMVESSAKHAPNGQGGRGGQVMGT
jgi:predicted Rossmann-fold nucleotide-binding protein